MTRLATGWAIFQGLLIEALPFLLLGVTIAGLARWLVPPVDLGAASSAPSPARATGGSSFGFCLAGL